MSDPKGKGVAAAPVHHPVTLQAIADDLGISTATVSLALRGNPAVADTTRRKVEERARELGYVYNRSAASLRTSRSHMIGVCVHDVANPYFVELLTSIEHVALESGRTMLLGTYGESFERQQRLLRTFREYRPDGVILCPAAGTALEDLDVLTRSGVPIVQLSREIIGAPLDFVGSDDRLGTFKAVRRLHELGHRRIAYFGGVEAVSTGRQRHDAYREALAECGLPFDPALIAQGWGRRQTGIEAVERVFAFKDPPTAALCFNDLTAFGAMLGLYKRGLEPGRDFSLIGYDDVSEASQWTPGLTSLSHAHREPGRLAAETLLKRIADPGLPVARFAIEPVLMERGTTAPPPTRKR